MWLLAALMVATFWINIRHLYLKTNPWTGEANWGHSVVIPIIGIYYLYLHRDELKRAKKQPLIFGRFSKGRIISSVAFIVAGLVLYMLPSIPAVAKPSHGAGG